MATAAELEAVGTKIASGVSECQGHLVSIPGTVNSFMSSWIASFIPDSVKQWAVDCVNGFISACSTFLGKVGEFLQGLAMPVMALIKTWDWLDVQKEAARISEAIDPGTNMALRVNDIWKGPAASAYAEAIKPQTGKAKRISDNAGKVALSLGIVGAAGLAFYIAIGVILVKFIAACVVVIAAFASVAFSWAGLALAVEEAAVNTAMVIAAVAALTACLAAQVQQAASIEGDLMSAFPNGAWPNPVVANFSDASTGNDTTGPKDDSDWRIRP